MKITTLLHNIGSARAEQQNFTYSIYKKFVVPPNIEKFDLRKQKHSIALQGSRGCGKTTYVRYFSHWTQFDKSRSLVDQCDEGIVLYWKPDTVFYRSMSKGWLSPVEANTFFMTIAGLELFQEFLNALDNISHHWPDVLSDLDRSPQFWPAITTITNNTERSLSSQLQWINTELYKTRIAIKKAKTDDLAGIDPGAMFKLLVPIIQNHCSRFQNVRFFLYVDEFENLDEQQQRIINGYRKGSDARLTWNVAYKRFANLTTKTDGDEQLNCLDDYRPIFMEEVYGAEQLPESAPGIYRLTDTSKLFTSEVFLLSLLNDEITTTIENLQAEILGDPNKINLRGSDQYQITIFKLMERIFPTCSAPELAKDAMQKSSVSKIVKDQLAKIDDFPRDLLEQFINDRPSDALVSYLISQQRSFTSKQLLGYINDAEPEAKSYSERINTYRLAALLSLNIRYHYINIPIYSGFDRFCLLAQNNIRHFTELCYQSLQQLDKDTDVFTLEDFPSVSSEQMHLGAIEASSLIVEHVVNFEPMGQTLARMVNRLGTLFEQYQRQPVQSEPEKVSFVIKGHYADISENLQRVINSAKCWRVLIEENITRDKRVNAVVSGCQYRLNPIFSPHFKISYRTGRTIEFKENDFRIICEGSNDEYSGWLKNMTKVSESSPQGDIFR
ncbi:MAG: hypothetical protein Q8L73_00765 [Methylotenera sp.]|nr:hypothetical protein [Methylotenera sp.]